MPLRPYQENLIKKIRTKAAAKDPVCAYLPTGAGKSHILASIAEGAESKGNNVLILAHRKELIRQNQNKLGRGAIFCAGLDQKNIEQITFGSIASVFTAREKFKSFYADKNLIMLIDEAHLLNIKEEGMYRVLIDFLNPALVMGLTATPFRLQSNGDNVSIVGEDKFFKSAAIGSNISELIADGYLSPLTSRVAKQQADLRGVSINTKGDFKDSEVEERMMQLPKAIQEIAEATTDRKRILVFCAGIDHAEKVAADLNAAGIKAQSVTSKTGDLFRDLYINEFNDGKIKALVGAEIFTTGYDNPEIDCVVILRATKSLSLFHQIVGRGLRIAPGKKDCLILDFGENFQRHGTLEDFKVFDKAKKGIGIGVPPVKVCPSCFLVNHASKKVCDYCFAEFPVKKKSEFDDGYYEGAIIKNEPKFYRVTRILYAPHTAKSGRDTFRVNYFCKQIVDTNLDEADPARYAGNEVMFSEWVSFPDMELAMQGNHTELFIGKKLDEWLSKRGMSAGMIQNIGGFDDFRLALFSISQPSELIVSDDPKNEKFKRIGVMKLAEPWDVDDINSALPYVDYENPFDAKIRVDVMSLEPLSKDSFSINDNIKF